MRHCYAMLQCNSILFQIEIEVHENKKKRSKEKQRKTKNHCINRIVWK